MGAFARTVAAALWMVACTPTSAVYCTPDETMCHGSCSALYKDPFNCGACDSVCSVGLVCSQGGCATSCSGGTVQCGQSCVDVKVDRANCGACGHACEAQHVCVDGSCSSTCAFGQKLCASDHGAYCANVQSDNGNCGDCGVVCGVQEVCFNLQCTSECAVGQSLCAPTEVGGYCADLTSDPHNCGNCGHTCGADAYCTASACACQGSRSMCGASCVDLATDTANCGGCGIKCSGTCKGNRCEVALATLVYGANAIAVDASNVYWIESTGDLRTVSTFGTGLKLLSSSASGTTVASDGKNVYWASGSSVAMVPVGGGSQTAQSLGTGYTAGEVITDDVSVYITHANGIVSFPVGGGAISKLVSGESSPHGLVVSAGLLFWANDNYQIRRAATDGSGSMTLATMTSAVGALATDALRVYFTWLGSEVLSIPADGSGPPMILASGLSSATRIATDGVSAYWLDSTGISKVPVGGGATMALASTGGGDLVLDASSVYWTTSSHIEKLTPK